MLKSIHKNNIITTPFYSTKDWSLSNIFNDDILLDENGNNIALEYISYDNNNPTFNYSCNIALEQQPDDLITFREGEKNNDLFYPDQEEKNIDGTFKRIVYSQVKEIFYNNYKNPTEIWGLENIDFENSKTKKFLTDKFRLFSIPSIVFGDKILGNSITIQDNLLDNTYIITDDGFNNLLAGNNLFSKQQEIGDFSNNFQTGSDFTCNLYFNILSPLSGSIILTAAQFSSTSASVILNWTDPFNNETGFVIEKSINSGSTYLPIIYTGADIITFVDTNVSFSSTYWYRVYAFNNNFTSSYSNTASVTLVQMGSPYNLTATLLSSSSPTESTQRIYNTSLTWNNTSPVLIDQINILRNDNNNPTVILANISSIITESYVDYNVDSTSSYSYKIENINITNSIFIYSNTSSVNTPYLIYDTTGEYLIGQMGGYNGGSVGWNGPWNLGNLNIFIAVDTTDTYLIGQLNNFNGGFGWSNIWNSITDFNKYVFVATESLDEYNIGSTNNFNGGYGWVTNWIQF